MRQLGRHHAEGRQSARARRLRLHTLQRRDILKDQDIMTCRIAGGDLGDGEMHRHHRTVRSLNYFFAFERQKAVVTALEASDQFVAQPLADALVVDLAGELGQTAIDEGWMQLVVEHGDPALEALEHRK